jgi:hypothetical protein
MAVIRTYHCPNCQKNVSPLFALILKPFVECPKCQTRVYVSRDMVIDNWRRNFYFLCVLLIWVGLTGKALASPPGPGQKVDPVGLAIGMAIIGWLPGLLFALPLIPVGYVLGHVVAAFVVTGPPPPPTYIPSGRYGSGYVPKDYEWR